MKHYNTHSDEQTHGVEYKDVDYNTLYVDYMDVDVERYRNTNDDDVIADVVEHEEDGRKWSIKTVDNPVYLFVLYRLIKNRDAKIIITASGAQTGVGKSLLAIIMSWELQGLINTQFDIERSFTDRDMYVDAWRYVNNYQDYEPKSVLLHDEIEVSFDSRRSMTERQVEASQRYQTMRAHNLVTIATAPSLTNLDLRITQNFDLWVQVTAQGDAVVWHLSENDFTGRPVYRPFKIEGSLLNMRWGVPASGPVRELKDRLDTMKDNVHAEENNQNSNDEDNGEKQKVQQLKDDVRELRYQVILDHYPQKSQKDIGRMLGVSQSTVSDYIDDLKHEGRIETVET